MCLLFYNILLHIIRLSAIIINIKIYYHTNQIILKHPYITAKSYIKKVNNNQYKHPNLIKT